MSGEEARERAQQGVNEIAGRRVEGEDLDELKRANLHVAEFALKGLGRGKGEMGTLRDVRALVDSREARAMNSSSRRRGRLSRRRIEGGGPKARRGPKNIAKSLAATAERCQFDE